jgi:hypothetical protein
VITGPEDAEVVDAISVLEVLDAAAQDMHPALYHVKAPSVLNGSGVKLLVVKA